MYMYSLFKVYASVKSFVNFRIFDKVTEFQQIQEQNIMRYFHEFLVTLWKHNQS